MTRAVSGQQASERELLRALLAALESPETAAAPLGVLDRHPAALVLAVARHHRLTPLLSLTLGPRLPEALAETCRRDRAVTTAHNLLLGDAAEACVKVLGARGVDSVVLKGLAYERFLYRATGCRPTSDIDLLVRGEQRRQACLALAGAGFEPKAAAPGFDEPDYHEISWTRAGATIDLHLGLAPPHRCTIDYPALWSQVREVPFGGVRAFALAPAHAAVFHALHMAIDHFDVPALYLLDLARLLPSRADTDAAGAVAAAWRCERAFTTAIVLAAAFLPAWATAQGPRPSPAPARARAVADRFGDTGPLPRAEQLRRKVAHIDGAATAVRYLAVQARRNARELLERHVRRRSPRARLGLPPTRS